MNWLSIIYTSIAFGFCIAFDSVLFSNQPIETKDAERLLTRDLPSSDIFVFLVRDFSLPKFYKYVNAYGNDEKSPIQPFEKLLQAKYSDSRLIDKPIEFSEQDVSAFTDVSSFEALEEILKRTNFPANFVALISSPTALISIKHRSKRLSSDAIVRQTSDERENIPHVKNPAKAENHLAMPVVLPPFNVSKDFLPSGKEKCLLYLEGIRIVLLKAAGNVYREMIIPSRNNYFNWDDSYVSCDISNDGIGNATFKVEVVLGSDAVSIRDKTKVVYKIAKGQTISLELSFNADVFHYWRLAKIRIASPFTITSVDKTYMESDLEIPGDLEIKNVQYMKTESIYLFAFACSMTPAGFQSVNKEWSVGMGFYNIEATLNAYNGNHIVAFNREVSDCVGSFSVGSWMGIITSFVLFAVLLFGYLMLQSVQSPDRFDDARQKGYTINFKE